MGGIIVLVALLFGVIGLFIGELRDDRPARAAGANRTRDDDRAADPRTRDNTRRIRELQTRVEGLEGELASLRDAVRASFTLPAASEDGANPGTLLDSYLLSFEKGGSGSEYFRLAVDAHAPAFVDRIIQLVGDPAQPENLRVELIEILGNERFKGDGRVVDGLLGLLTADAPVEIAQSALNAIASTADSSAIPPLERYIGEVPWSNLPYEVFGTIAGLAGDERNAVLRRLVVHAKDAVARNMVLNRIDRADADGALLLFDETWKQGREARVAAADRLGTFRTDEFKRFVDDRLAVETDPDVRNSLKEAKAEQARIPGFDAMQAAGPPDADPSIDDPKAWATKSGDMGVQWIELTYDPPLRANRVRIFEVNSAGAVVEIQVTDARGQKRSAWRGDDPTVKPGVFDVRIDAGGAKVAKLRVILDTDRRPGWNEIDAVELVGSSGRAWAVSAVASSTYGDKVYARLLPRDSIGLETD